MFEFWPAPRPFESLGRGLGVWLGFGCGNAYRSRGRAQRWPVWARRPSGRAEKRSGRGARGHRRMATLRALTRRSCLNAAAQQRSEFCGGTPAASIAGCPQQSGGTRPVGSPFFGSFLWRNKERDCAAGRMSRPAALPAQRPNFITKSASSAHPESATSYQIASATSLPSA